MTLRTRLLLVLVGVVTIGLIVSDLVVYASLQSFLEGRIDPQLQVVAYPLSRILLAENDRDAGFVGEHPTPHPGFRPEHHAAYDPAAQLLPGTYGELVQRGRVVGRKRSYVTLGGKAAPAPLLPRPLPVGTARHPEIFTAASTGSHPVTYRVLATPLGPDGLTAVVAVPLTDVADTLSELRLIEFLVSLGILVGLGGFTWWLVRRDLRPLEDMATAAGEIAGGDLSKRVSPAEDRTEVGRLGLALNAMLGEIEGAFAARSASEHRLRRFMADASHELRTPLTSIRGYAEIFDLGARDRPEDVETAMHHIREEADRMHVLVDDLLLLSRLDQERPLQVRPVNAVEVIGRAVASAEVRVPRCPVHFDAPAELVVPCDAERLRQVADNFLSNAVRCSPDGAAVEVRLSGAGRGLRLEVVDRGPGVPPEIGARVFEPFFRADPSRARVTGGTGLGLAIVAAIARAHGGAVGVDANAGGGAVFWCEIPGNSEPAKGDPQVDLSGSTADLA